MIHLHPSTILNVPLHKYHKDFSFIINGVEFKTSYIIADMLSPVICRIHSTDPTIDTFTINTQEKGDFSKVLDLVNFKQQNITKKEIPFISEVIQILGNKSIEFDDKNYKEQIKIDNVFDLIKEHENKDNFFSSQLSNEINFLSSHFYEICETNLDSFASISFETLFNIIDNENLQLNSEDQLLYFINKLYSKNPDYSVFYDNVLFGNVSSSAICDFLSVFKINDLNQSIWNQIASRLEQDVNDVPTYDAGRYRKQKEIEKPKKEKVKKQKVAKESSNTDDRFRQPQEEQNGNDYWNPPNDAWNMFDIRTENLRNEHRERNRITSPRNTAWHQIDVLIDNNNTRNSNNTRNNRQRNSAWQPIDQLIDYNNTRNNNNNRTNNNYITRSNNTTTNNNTNNTNNNNNNINNNNNTNITNNNNNISRTTSPNNEHIRNERQQQPQMQLAVEASFEASERVEFNGIINYLRNRLFDNIDITASSILNRGFSPYNVAHFEDPGSNFQSKDARGSWICFDFKDRRVIPTNYEIKSRNCSEGASHLRNWVIEGSNNNSSWEILDQQNNCEYLNGISYAYTFPINNPNSRQYRYIRLRLSGKDWQGQYILMFNSFEIYGSLLSSQ